MLKCRHGVIDDMKSHHKYSLQWYLSSNPLAYFVKSKWVRSGNTTIKRPQTNRRHQWEAYQTTDQHYTTTALERTAASKFQNSNHPPPRAWVDPGIFAGGGGGGGGVQISLTKKALTTFFFVLSLFHRSQMVNFKEIFYFHRFQRGSNIFQGGGGV